MNTAKAYLTVANTSLQEARATTHVAYLDGLRAVAALYVLLHHTFLQINAAASESLLIRAFDFPFRQGRYAVDLFIVISGFCLMLPVVKNNSELRNGAIAFFKKRAKRILPTYFLALALSLLLIATVIGKKTGTMWDISIPVTNWDLITHVLLIQDMFSETCGKINPTYWSISVEWRIYFLFPLILIFWRRHGALKTVAAITFTGVFLWYALTQTGLNFYTMAPHYIALFAFGMLAAQISTSNSKQQINIRERYHWKLFAIVLLGYIAASDVFPDIKVSVLYMDLIVGLCAACLLVSVNSGKFNVVYQMLSWQPLVFIGTFAYSIYLIHAPLLQVLTQYVLNPGSLSPSFTLLFYLLVGVPLIVGASYVFFLVAERPFIQSRKVG